MRGDCVKLEMDRISCFSTRPWHWLEAGNVMFYPQREPLVDDLGRWAELRRAGSFLVAHRVEDVVTVQLDSGCSAVSAALAPTQPPGHEPFW